MEVAIDEEKVDEAVLALLYLTTFKDQPYWRASTISGDERRSRPDSGRRGPEQIDGLINATSSITERHRFCR